MKFKILILLIFIFTVSGCTIYKKQHFKGYTIQWNKKFSSKKHKGKSDETSELKSEKKTETSSVDSESKKSAESISIVSDINSIEESNYTYNKNKEIASDFYSKSVPAPVTEGTIKKSQIDESGSFEKTMSESEKGDYLLYLSSILMSLSALGAIKLNRKKLNRITKWAAKNPKKAQLTIAGIQIPLMSGAIYAGYNLHKMGYDISDTTNYVFGGLMLAGFLATPFFKKKQEFVLNKKMTRRRLAFLTITMSSLMVLLNFGNNVSTNNTFASVTNALETIDNVIFPATTLSNNADSNQESEETRSNLKNERRKGAAAIGIGMAILSILGLIFMVCLVCMGACSVVLGVLLLADGTIGGIIAILLGPLLFKLGIEGFKAIRNWRRRQKSGEPKKD